ncbi:MAG: diguanylate cyclase [Bacteroidales bacterium]|nr:diguanylate cyclase [Bacteroidales bacterium]
MEKYFEELPMAITVCDVEGTILDMNHHSTVVNGKFPGDKSLVGSNVLDCHPEPARTMVLDMLKEGKKNVYTIEKNGIKKLIYQTPWYDNSKFAGLMEFSMEIPFEMPHFVRKPKK